MSEFYETTLETAWLQNRFEIREKVKVGQHVKFIQKTAE